MHRTALFLSSLIIVFISTAVARVDNSHGKLTLTEKNSVRIYSENEKGIPDFISGVLSDPDMRRTAVSAAVDFFNTNKAAFRMKDPVAELSPIKIETDRLGMTHVRFKQLYNGLPVYGGEMIAHYSSKGYLETVNGNYEANINLNTVPAISSDQAISLAETDLVSFFAKGTPDTPELVVFPWEGSNLLCWRFYLRTTEKMGRWEYFVSASDGAIIYKANRIMNSEEIGTGVSVLNQPRNHIDTWYNGSGYEMIDHTRQANDDLHGHNGQMPDGNIIQTYEATTSLPGVIATDADNAWTAAISQGPSVDAQVYAATYYDWLLRDFGRNGYDDAGASMYSSVNYSAEGNNNAYWNGEQIAVWSYGTGWRSLAGCPDVIAHEWAHAVTEYSSNLIYEKEAGALNESFSDMMGCAFEYVHDTLDAFDWYMAENGIVSGNGFRNISNPPEFGDPDTYEGAYWQNVQSCIPSDQNDYCGVHTNSGVGNKWYYLLSVGGMHNSVTVTGIGVEEAIQVAYRANVYYWTPASTYLEAALGTVMAANDIDPTLATTMQVVNAWHAVMVPIPEPSLIFDYAGGVPHTTTPDSPASLDITISGYLGASPVPGTARFHYSIDGGEYAEATMTDLGINHYSTVLPNIYCGHTLAYYISAESDYAGSFTDPPNIADAYKPVVMEATVPLIEDNFETDMGWSSGGTASAGDWERGVPAADGSYGDPTEDFDGSGSCYLTENVAGESDVDAGAVWLDSPMFDLSNGNGEIVYAVWFNNSAGPNPHEDIMTVSISNNNGADWVVANTIGPTENASGGWIQYSFVANDFVEPTDQMKIRFSAEDVGGTSWVEAGVDGVQFIYYDCPLFTCGDLDDNGDVNILDIVFLINNLYKGGPDPDPLVSGDVDHNGVLNILDIVYLINFVYKGGADPSCT